MSPRALRLRQTGLPEAVDEGTQRHRQLGNVAGGQSRPRVASEDAGENDCQIGQGRGGPNGQLAAAHPSAARRKCAQLIFDGGVLQGDGYIQLMTRGGIAMLVCGFCCLTLGPSTRAVTTDPGDFPYQGIIDRNVFVLKPPPEPPSPESLKPPPPKITAVGIANTVGKLRALLKVMEPPKPTEPGKPPTPAQEQTYLLAVGQRQGQVEVLAIDGIARTVKVDNYGTVMSVPLVTNLPASTAPASGPVPSPMAARNLPNFGGPPSPPALPGVGATAASTVPTSPAYKAIPTTRQLRLPTPSAPAAPTSQAVITAPTPTPTVQQPASQAAANKKPLSPEDELLLLHAINAFDPNSPPPPPPPQ